MNNNYLEERDWYAIREAINVIYNDKELNNKNIDHWHYTTLNTVGLIFKKTLEKIDHFDINRITQAEMLASNIRYLNDTQEFNDGVEELRNISPKGKSINDQYMDNVYLISFCGDGDLLSQWKYYGKESGVAIKFNFNNIKYKYWANIWKDGSKKVGDDDLFKIIADAIDDTFIDENTRPLRVRYEHGEKRRLYEILSQNLDRVRMYDSLMCNLFVPLCKHECFSEEAESRLLFYAHKFDKNKYGDKNFVPDITYNYGKSHVKPALKVHMEAVDKDANIIEQIIVGPGYNQNLVFNALIHMFDRNRYHFHDSATGDTIQWEQFIKAGPDNDGPVRKVKVIYNNREQIREAYKCENGLIIMKSSMPFRGD